MNRIIRAFFYSFAGLAAAWRDEAAFRQEVILCVVLAPLALWIAPDKISLILMWGSLFLVLIVELLNTAVEAAINRIGTDIHPLSKKAKDTASAAVFLSLLNVAVVWGIILIKA